MSPLNRPSYAPVIPDYSNLAGGYPGGYGAGAVNGYAQQPAYAPLPLPSALTGEGGMSGFTPASISSYNNILKPGGIGPAAASPLAPGAFSTPGTALGPTGAGAAPQKQGIGTMGYVQAGIDGLQTLGNLWMGFKQMKLANKSFKFNKDMAETNLANTIKAYNTNLGDRARSRGFTEGQSQAEIDRYVAANSATRRG